MSDSATDSDKTDSVSEETEDGATTGDTPEALSTEDVDSPLLSARGVTKSFDVRDGAFGRTGGAVRAVDGVDLDVWPGEVLGLVGESGCGKSTLGRVLLGLLPADDGEIVFDGTDVRQASGRTMRTLRPQMQIVFQDPYSSLDPRTTVGDSIGEGLRAHGMRSQQRSERVTEMLDLVGLEPGCARRYPHQFSGGQRQRIGIARALALEPRFLVADEPISALDVSIQSQVLNLLSDLQARLDFTLLFVAHDLAVVEHLCDRVAVMYLGRIVEIGTRDKVFGDPEHPYTEALLSAIPVADPERERDHTRLKGELPSPLNPPTGCHFHPRCPLAVDGVCDVEVPELLAPPGELHDPGEPRDAATPMDAATPSDAVRLAPSGHLAACHLRTGAHRDLDPSR